MELMSKITVGASSDELALRDYLDYLRMASPDIQNTFINQHNGVLDRACSSFDEVGAQMFELISSKEGIITSLFSNSMEVFQIMGLALLQHDGENTLLINSLSDFALMADLGLPIKSDHQGYYADEVSRVVANFKAPQIDWVTHSMNHDFYSALLAVHGSSMESYLSRLKSVANPIAGSASED
jgi:hypothetical protein